MTELDYVNYEVIFKHGVLVEAPAGSTAEYIKELAVEMWNNNELDELYMTINDVDEILGEDDEDFIIDTE
jgi:hypothetical protein